MTKNDSGNEIQVQIAVTKQNGHVTLTVDDDCSGISESNREAVFEPFKRLAKERQPVAGLGLAIVRRICGRLDDEVSVDSSQLGGARFEIRLQATVASGLDLNRKGLTNSSLQTLISVLICEFIANRLAPER